MKTEKYSAYYQYYLNKDEKFDFNFDLIKYEIDKKLYYYGDHLKIADINRLQKLKWILVYKILDCYVFFKSLTNKKSNQIFLFSTAYFNLEKSKINEFNIVRPPWLYNINKKGVYDFKLYKKAKSIKNWLNTKNFNQLTSILFIQKVKEFESELKDFIIANNVVAIFQPNELGFFEKLAIKIFHDLKLKSFNFIHGLPGVYNYIDNNRSDYLVVWGNAIKNNYANVGIEKDKILVSGHPKYQLIKNNNLRNSLNNILVICKSTPGCPFKENYVIPDRSNSIAYLLQIKKVLSSLGVTKVRFRVHPSENYKWYLQYIDNNFFIADLDSTEKSLKQSTLVIGTVSTFFMESLIYGVNYIVYEPKIDIEKNIDNLNLVPPFDGSDSRVVVAFNEEELTNCIINKKESKVDILNDYLNIEKGFDISFITGLIN